MDFENILGEFAHVQPKLTTSKGKAVSHFTMKCYFSSGREHFTFRGDTLLEKLRTNGDEQSRRQAQRMNQLDAIVLKYRTIEGTVLSCKIWNNYNSPGEQLIFCKSADGTVSINKLEKEMKELRSIKQASNSR